MNVKEIRRKNLRGIARSVGGVTQLAGRLSRSQSQISHLIGSNPIKNIGDKLASEVEKIFSKPNGWLDREHYQTGEEIAFYEVETPRRKTQQVPLLSWSEINLWLESSNRVGSGPAHYIVTNLSISTQSFAVKVEGDSMESANGISFPNGAIVVIDPEISATSGSFVIARPAIGNPLVFKQYVMDGGKRYLKPLNTRYPIVEITSQALICGVARLMLVEFK